MNSVALDFQDQIRSLLKEANRALDTADHLAYVTYPIVNELKLLVTITENLYLAMVYAMEAMLQYDYLYKRISFLPHDFNSKYDMFKRIAQKYNMNRLQIALLLDLRSLLESHKKSPIVFTRNDKIVICSDAYKTMKTLNIDKVKEYLNTTKLFMRRVNEIFERNDIRRI